MIEIEMKVSGEREIALRFEQFPEHLRERLLRAIKPLLSQIAGQEKAAAPRDKGLLAAEIGATWTASGPDFVAGYVGIEGGLPRREYGKAGTEEYGAHRKITVRRPHADVWQIGLKHLRRNHPEALYERTVNIIARRFVHGPFAAMRGEIEAALREAVEDAAREAAEV